MDTTFGVIYHRGRQVRVVGLDAVCLMINVTVDCINP